MALYKTSLGFLRTLFLIFGLLLCVWLMATFYAWSMETWDTGPAGVLLIPYATLLFGIVSLIVLLISIFRSVATQNTFLKRMALFFSTSLILSLVFLTFAGKLYWIPILRITNAPLTIFDRFTLENQLGFKPLLPTQPFPELEPSRSSFRRGSLDLHFIYGGGDLDIIQATEISTSNVLRWCNEMQQDTESYDTTPIIIAGQQTLLYSPKKIKRDALTSYCVSLNDRVIYISPGRGRGIGTIEPLKIWLENLEFVK